MTLALCWLSIPLIPSLGCNLSFLFLWVVFWWTKVFHFDEVICINFSFIARTFLVLFKKSFSVPQTERWIAKHTHTQCSSCEWWVRDPVLIFTNRELHFPTLLTELYPPFPCVFMLSLLYIKVLKFHVYEDLFLGPLFWFIGHFLVLY